MHLGAQEKWGRKKIKGLDIILLEKNKRYLLFYCWKLACCKHLLLSHGWIIRLSSQLYITGCHTMQNWCRFLTITHPSWLSVNSPKMRKCVFRMLISRNISKALGIITKGHFHKRGRGHQHYFWLDGCKHRAFLEISRDCFFFFLDDYSRKGCWD